MGGFGRGGRGGTTTTTRGGTTTTTTSGTTTTTSSSSGSTNPRERMSGRGGTGYRGRQNVSRSGKKCTPWAGSVTHTSKIYPQAGLESNYCRNPAPHENGLTIWCFIEGGTPRHFWEYCDPVGSSSKKGGVTIKGGSTTTTGGGGGSSKVTLERCEQSSPYSNNRFPCANAFKPGGGSFTHTNRGVGMWW